MKQVLLPLALLCFAFTLSAQITITKADFLLEIGDSSFFLQANTPDDVAVPTAGVDQVWDYSTVAYSTNFPFFFENPAGTIAEFPDANIVIPSSTSGILPGLVIPAKFILRLDDQGLRTLGRVDGTAAVPLQGTTGGATDSLLFPGSISDYGDPSIHVQLPMNYEDSQSGDLVLHNNFILTVAAFGLDHVPGSADVVVRNEYNTIGWGTLKVPDVATGETIEMEVLLREETTTRRDTFLLGGAPAPQALLDAFGLMQGNLRTTTEYTFWAKGLNDAVMKIEVAPDGSQTVGLNRDIPMVISSTRGIAEQLQQVSVFPNPTTQDFQLELAQNGTQDLTLSLLNTLGQTVHQEKLPRTTGTLSQQISLPTGTQGIYQLILRNEKGQVVGQEKIIQVK